MYVASFCYRWSFRSEFSIHLLIFATTGARIFIARFSLAYFLSLVAPTGAFIEGRRNNNNNSSSSSKSISSSSKSISSSRSNNNNNNKTVIGFFLFREKDLSAAFWFCFCFVCRPLLAHGPDSPSTVKLFIQKERVGRIAFHTFQCSPESAPSLDSIQHNRKLETIQLNFDVI